MGILVLKDRLTNRLSVLEWEQQIPDIRASPSTRSPRSPSESFTTERGDLSDSDFTGSDDESENDSGSDDTCVGNDQDSIPASSTPSPGHSYPSRFSAFSSSSSDSRSPTPTRVDARPERFSAAERPSSSTAAPASSGRGTEQVYRFGTDSLSDRSLTPRPSRSMESQSTPPSKSHKSQMPGSWPSSNASSHAPSVINDSSVEDEDDGSVYAPSLGLRGQHVRQDPIQLRSSEKKSKESTAAGLSVADRSGSRASKTSDVRDSIEGYKFRHTRSCPRSDLQFGAHLRRACLWCGGPSETSRNLRSSDTTTGSNVNFGNQMAGKSRGSLDSSGAASFPSTTTPSPRTSDSSRGVEPSGSDAPGGEGEQSHFRGRPGSDDGTVFGYRKVAKDKEAANKVSSAAIGEGEDDNHGFGTDDKDKNTKDRTLRQGAVAFTPIQWKIVVRLPRPARDADPGDMEDAISRFSQFCISDRAAHSTLGEEAGSSSFPPMGARWLTEAVPSEEASRRSQAEATVPIPVPHDSTPAPDGLRPDQEENVQFSAKAPTESQDTGMRVYLSPEMCDIIMLKALFAFVRAEREEDIAAEAFARSFERETASTPFPQRRNPTYLADYMTRADLDWVHLADIPWNWTYQLENLDIFFNHIRRRVQRSIAPEIQWWQRWASQEVPYSVMRWLSILDLEDKINEEQRIWRLWGPPGPPPFDKSHCWVERYFNEQVGWIESICQGAREALIKAHQAQSPWRVAPRQSYRAKIPQRATRVGPRHWQSVNDEEFHSKAEPFRERLQRFNSTVPVLHGRISNAHSVRWKQSMAEAFLRPKVDGIIGWRADDGKSDSICRCGFRRSLFNPGASTCWLCEKPLGP